MTIIPFTFDAQPVRTILRDGEPWFHASDVCAALGYTHAPSAIAKHVEAEDKCAVSLQLPGSAPTFVSESGLYGLIFGSQLEAAVHFRRWVTKEVIPSIRRTGGFGHSEGAAKAIETVRRLHERTDQIVEHKTQHDFYKPGSVRATEHIANTVNIEAARAGLDATSVELARRTNVDKVMAEVYGDPIAIRRIAATSEAIRIAVAKAVTVDRARRAYRGPAKPRRKSK